MSYAPSNTYFDQKATICGSFHEKTHGSLFEFSKNDDNLAFAEDFPHKVWVKLGAINDSGYRYGHVMKTMAYVCVDEDAFGAPVVEKWNIKKHRLYENKAK